jgi:hypothetical protein
MAVVYFIFLFGGRDEYLRPSFCAGVPDFEQARSDWVDGYFVFDWDGIIEGHDQTGGGAAAFAGGDFVGGRGG